MHDLAGAIKGETMNLRRVKRILVLLAVYLLAPSAMAQLGTTTDVKSLSPTVAANVPSHPIELGFSVHFSPVNGARMDMTLLNNAFPAMLVRSIVARVDQQGPIPDLSRIDLVCTTIDGWQRNLTLPLASVTNEPNATALQGIESLYWYTPSPTCNLSLKSWRTGGQMGFTLYVYLYGDR